MNKKGHFKYNISDLVNYAAGLKSNANNEILVSYRSQNLIKKDGSNIKIKYTRFFI